MTFDSILHRVFLGNSVEAYLRTALTIALGLGIVWVAKVFVIARLQKWSEKTETRYDDFIVNAIQRYLVPLVYFAVFHVAIHQLVLHPFILRILTVLTSLLVTIVGILLVNSFLKFTIFEVVLKKQSKDLARTGHFQTLMPALSVLVWVIGAIFLLDNLGFKISAIVAGLGIGGVAVALAASAVLADLFAYVVIMMDHPFAIGDFIIVGDFMGAIEKIGIKTTRIRSLSGELIVFANKDLTDSRIRNYRVMRERRIVFSLGLTYDTPSEKLKEVPGIIKRVVESQQKTRFDRAHFASFGNFNLAFEVVYFVLSDDYNLYMDIQQAINFAIKEEFEKRHIEFAFPTQTLHISNGAEALQPKPASASPGANPA